MEFESELIIKDELFSDNRLSNRHEKKKDFSDQLIENDLEHNDEIAYNSKSEEYLQKNEVSEDYPDKKTFDITSVVTAEKIIKAHRNISDSIIRGQVVSRVIDKGIHADSKTHHELTRFLISIYDYENAYSFCKYSLQIYQHCLDLLADYVCICIKKGEVDEVCELIVFFEECVKFENWDKYVYEVIFLWYVEKIHSDWMKRMSFFASAYRIARKRQEFYKYDEIGYCWEAELSIKQNRIEEAERKLKEWILEPIEPEIDYKNMLICPRCCRLLLELLQMRNDYEMIIKVALRGMEGNQDKNSIAYFDKQGQLAMQYVRIKEEKEKEYTKIAGGLKPWMMR